MNTSWILRPMERADLEAVEMIEQQSFDDCWSRESFEFEIVGNEFSHPMVLEQEGKIIGFLVYWVMFEQAQIANIAISPAFRGQGLGHVLMEYALQAAKKLGAETFTLEVRPSNEKAKHLYETHGFTFLHRVKSYYSDGEDALVLMRVLE